MRSWSVRGGGQETVSVVDLCAAVVAHEAVAIGGIAAEHLALESCSFLWHSRFLIQ